MIKNRKNRKGFTLIELLVVIAIIAVLAVVVVLTLNPAELLRQARDSNRLSDFATMKSAISLYATDVATTTAMYVERVPAERVPTLPFGWSCLIPRGNTLACCNSSTKHGGTWW